MKFIDLPNAKKAQLSRLYGKSRYREIVNDFSKLTIDN